MLGATENVTVAEPVPAKVGGPGLVFVNQPPLMVTCHTQVGPCGIDSVKVTVPPLAGTLALVGVTVCAQEMAGCVTLTVFPAIVSDPSLALYPFAATETVTVPESVLPEAPLRTASHAVLLTAVQLQPPPCVRLTVNVTVSPPGCALTVVGLTLYRQGTPSCVTVTAWSAMVSVPDRATPVLAATATVTEVEVTAETVRNPVLDTAVNVQSVPCALVTVRNVDPPSELIFWVVGDTV